MRHIDKKKQIAFASLTEIRQWLAIEAERLADKGLKGGGPRSRVAASAHLLNWLSCWFLSLTPAERESIAMAGKVVFDRHAASDEPLCFERSVPAADGEPRVIPGIGLDHRVQDADRQGDSEPAQRRRTPKRRP